MAWKMLYWTIVREEVYKQLVNDREKYKGMLKGPVMEHHKNWLNEQLGEIRKALKDAHRARQSSIKS